MLFVIVICFDPLVSPMAVSGKAELPGGVVKMNRLATPVPLREKVSLPAAPSSTVRVLESLPAEPGAYRTPNVHVCPSGRFPLQLSLTIENAALFPPVERDRNVAAAPIGDRLLLGRRVTRCHPAEAQIAGIHSDPTGAERARPAGDGEEDDDEG